MTYIHSTQKKDWTYESENEIAQIWEQNTQRGGDLLTTEECQSAVQYYENNLLFSNHLKSIIPFNVMCSCALIYKHFFMKQSPQLFDPKMVALSCLELGRKVEEFRFEEEQPMFSVEYLLGKLIKSSLVKEPEKKKVRLNVLMHEQVIMEELNFQINKFPAMECVKGFKIDLCQNYYGSDPSTYNQLMNIFNSVGDKPNSLNYNSECEEVLKYIYLSNAPLIYSPSVLALSVHYIIFEKLNIVYVIKKYIDEYLIKKLSRDVDEDSIDKIKTMYLTTRERVLGQKATISKVVGPILNKLRNVLKIGFFGYDDADIASVMNTTNGKVVVNQNSFVKWENGNNSIQLWTPICKPKKSFNSNGKISNDPFSQIPFMLLHNCHLVVIVFNRSSVEGISSLMNWVDAGNILSTNLVLLIGTLNNHQGGSEPNVDINGYIKTFKESCLSRKNDLIIEYIPWGNGSSFNDILRVFTGMRSHKLK
ncbi:hypothetical protein QTN25_010546 [Entamoeba marina]